MATFAYSGRTRAGQNVNGEREADSMEAAVAALRREQVMVTKINPVKEKAGRRPKAKVAQGQEEVSPKSLAVFTRQFSVMIDAGLPLVQCLEILGTQEEDKNFGARDPGDPRRGRERRVARRRDAQEPEGLRRALHQHDRRRRGRRYPRHDSQAAGDLHREGRQAEEPGAVGHDLSGRDHRHRRRRRRRHSVEGHPDLRDPVRRPGRRAAAADARSSSRSATAWCATCRSCWSASAPLVFGFRAYYKTAGRPDDDRRHHAQGAGASGR